MIDFHVHAGDFPRLRDDIQNLLTRRPLEADILISEVFSSPTKMESYLRRNGVTKAVIIAECGPGTNFTIDSAMIARFTRGNDFFIPFGNINPNYHNVIEEFWKSIDLNVMGFKFYPADHSFDPLLPQMQEVYRLCQDRRLPIIFHTGLTAQRDTEQKFINPLEFEPIAVKWPDLIIILAHGGKPHWHKEAATMALNYANVYIDTALLDPLTLFQSFPDIQIIQHKLVFGSDWPVAGSYSAMMEKYQRADLPEEFRNAIFHENAKRILSLTRKEASPLIRMRAESGPSE
jgi:predicted TIM-barrel fold metal-dependent hydrolase